MQAVQCVLGFRPHVVGFTPHDCCCATIADVEANSVHKPRSWKLQLLARSPWIQKRHHTT